MAAGESGVHDLTEEFERLVGAARRGTAVSVEPAFDVDPPDGVQREAAEGGDQLPFEHTIGELAGRRGAAAAVRRQPLVKDEVAEQGSAGAFARGVSHAERQSPLPGVLDSHERGRADGRSDRFSLNAPVPDEAAMSGRAYPHAEAGYIAVPDRVFPRVRLQPADTRVGQPDPSSLHACLPDRTGDRVSNASRTVASDRWGVFQGGLRLLVTEQAADGAHALPAEQRDAGVRMPDVVKAGRPAARLPPSRRARGNPATARGCADRRSGRPIRRTGAGGRGRRALPRTARPCAGRSCCRADRAAPPGRSAIGVSGSPTCGTR